MAQVVVILFFFRLTCQSFSTFRVDVSKNGVFWKDLPITATNTTHSGLFREQYSNPVWGILVTSLTESLTGTR